MRDRWMTACGGRRLLTWMVVGGLLASALAAVPVVSSPVEAQSGGGLSDYAVEVLADEPVGYWDFEEGSGSVAVDQVSAINGSLIGPTWIGETGVVGSGSALRFYGNDHVWLGTPAALRTDDFTVEAWTRLDAPPPVTGGQWGYLVRSRWYGLAIRVDPQGRAVAAFYPNCASEQSVVTLYSPEPITDGQWHHVAMSKDSERFALYVDGVSVAEAPGSAVSCYQSGNVAFGRDGNYNGGYYVGDIDEVAWYDRALTADRVLAHYCVGSGNAGLPCGPEDLIDAGPDQVVPEGSVVQLDGWVAGEGSTDVSRVEGVAISAQANIFGSGRTSPPGGGVPPVFLEDLMITPGSVVRLVEVDGQIRAAGGWPWHGADGHDREGSNIFSSSGISGIISFTGGRHNLFLVGVFLGEEVPADPAPERLDFTDDLDFGRLEPELHQTFFIGDGRTSDGDLQEFVAPAGATRLFVGFADSFGFVGSPGSYGDNSGTLIATFEATTGASAAAAVSWEVVDSQGPPIELLGADTLTPAFRAWDDGTYRLRMTAHVGEEVLVDEVTVTVGNVEPSIGVVAAPTTGDGTVMVSASVTDPGILDTHVASVDWGDGSPLVEGVPAVAQGAGWGLVTAAHVYAVAGTYEVIVAIEDDDGGSVTTSTMVEVDGAGPPVMGGGIACALCVLGTGTGQGSATVDMNGQADWTIRGGVHSNGSFKIQSPGRLTVEPEGAVSVVAGGISCTNIHDPNCPPPHIADAEPMADPLAALELPSGGVAQQWQCNGTCEVHPGTYRGPFNHNPGTVTRLHPGTYVFTGDLFAVGGTIEVHPSAGPDEGVTLVFVGGSSLEIRNQGALHLRPPADGPLAGVVVAYERSSTRTLGWRGSRNEVTGTVYAPNAQLRLDSDAPWVSASRFIVGTASSQASTVTLDPTAGPNAGGSGGSGGGGGEQPAVAAPPLVVPELGVEVEVGQAELVPGGVADVSVTVTHEGALVAVPMLVATTNTGSGPIDLDEAMVVVEALGAVSGEWSPVAAAEGTVVALAGVGVPREGTVYGAGDGITGTVIDPGGSAVWAGLVTIQVPADVLAGLLDDEVVADLRVSVELSSAGAPLGSVIRLPDALLDRLRYVGATVEGPVVSYSSSTGTPVSVPVPDLGPGGAEVATFVLHAPAAPARSAYGSDAEYMAALAVLDGTGVTGLVSVEATGSVGSVFGFAAPATVPVRVPMVVLDAGLVPAARPAEPSAWELILTNTGSAPATAIDLAVEVDAAVEVTGLPEVLAPGASAVVIASMTMPTDQVTTLRPEVTLGWRGPTVEAYGPIGLTGLWRVVLPAALSVTKQVNFATTTPPGRVPYQIAIVNTGDDPVTGVVVTDTPDPGAAILPDTIVTTQGTVTSGTGGEPTLVVEVGTIPGGGAAIVDYALDYTVMPPGQVTLVNQAEVTSTELAPVWSDDPTKPGPADPTVYTFASPPGGSGPGSGGPGDGSAVGTAQIEGLVPGDAGVVSAPTEVSVGVVTPAGDATIVEWFLTTYPAGTDPGRAQVLAEGTGDPSDSVLGTFDPTVSANGIWSLRLTVVDSAGAVSYVESSLVVDGQLKLGRYTVTYEDMAVPVAGIPIQVLRTYDTLDKDTEGDFGYGWNLELANFRVQTNRTLGLGPWTGTSCGPGLIFVPLCFTPGSSRFVTVTWPDGRTETFDLTPTGNTFFPVAMTPSYTARPGATSTLTPAPGDTSGSRGGDGHMRTGGFGDGAIYDPQRFVLTARDGTRYLLDRTTGLVEATDRNGNTITVTAGGVVSSAGGGIVLARDGQGRITTVTGPDGASVAYDYDGNGDLVAVVDPNGNTTSYSYQDHHLAEVVDPVGEPWRRLTYDDTGRLAGITDASGNTTAIEVDPEARTQVVTSPDGRVTTVSTFDERGNEVVRDEIFDGVSHPTTFTYSADGLDLITSRTDPEGNTWSGEYDSGGNLVRFVDSEGHATTIGYDSFGFPTRVVDAAGAVTGFGYDGFGNLVEIDHPVPGAVTTYGYDGRGNRVSSTDPEGNTTTWEYTSQGWVSSRISPEGFRTEWTHDDAGRVLTEHDVATGATTAWAYDQVGNLVSRTDPEGNATTWGHDAADRVVGETDPEGNTTNYGYDPMGNVVSVIDALANETTYGFDSANRVVSRVDPLGHATTWGYDGAGRVVEIIDARGGVTSYGYDLAGRRVSATAPERGTTTSSVDGNGRVIAETNGLGDTTSYGFDPMGRMVSQVDPTGRETRWTFDAAGRLVEVIAPGGRSTTYGYDLAGRMVTTVDPTGERWVYGYDGDGNQTSATDPLARTTLRGFDSQGRVVSVTDPAGAATTYSFDLAGRVDRVTGPDGDWVQHAYDRRGLVTATADRLGNTTTVVYDEMGRRVGEVDPRGNPTHYSYDPAGRVTAMIDALGGTVGFGYDQVGNRTSVTDPNGTTRTATFNLAGDLVGESDPLGNATTHSYDPAGRRVSTTNPLGHTSTYSYDSSGRMVGEVRPDATNSYRYDPAGRRDQIVDPSGTTTWVFDPAGRPTQVTSAAGTLAYGYDPAGQLTSLTGPMGTITYTHDLAGRLATLTDGSGTTTFEWTPGGRQSLIERPNGVTTSQSYDLAGRLVGVDHAGPDGPVAVYDYALDEAGNRVGVVTLDGTESYVLDELNRLLSTSYVDGTSEAFSYDPAGNRLTHTDTGGTTTYAYDLAGRLATTVGPDGITSYTHDPAGRLTATSDGTTYTYDSAGWLSSATVDGTSHSFATDADGIRVEVDGQAQLWDRTGALPLLVHDGQPHTWAPGGILSTGDTWVLHDALGSVRHHTDLTGAVTNSVDYRAFGQPTTPWDGFGYTGGIHDPTGHIHLRARQLDPGLGRFSTPDPIQPGAPGTGGYNLYTYVANNPTTFTDPTGQAVIVEHSKLSGEQSRRTVPTVGPVGGGLFRLLMHIATCLHGVGWSICKVGSDLVDEEPSGAGGAGGGGGAPPIDQCSVFEPPERLTRVRRLTHAGSETLGPPGAVDAFVAPASDIANLTTASDVARSLTLLDSNGQLIEGPLEIVEFDTPPGLACPLFRDNQGFIPGGQTAGGTQEYVVPNYKISELSNVTRRVVP